ncbi:MAG: methyltransferase domain-containing protein [Anaerolineae bacterium]|nr:MAG: methyltransferase domain-containing protein [Anaerolineae bacterium]
MSDIDMVEMRKIFVSGKTQWRAYMNLHSAHICLTPPVLDIGSGRYGTASYQRYIPEYANVEVRSVDLDPGRFPSVIGNLTQGIPFQDAYFNTCLAYGVFGYLYNFEDVLRDIHRVMKPEGQIHLGLPFLDRVASDGGDCLRYTAAAIEKMLTHTGFDTIQITPYGTGACAAALDQIEFIVPRILRGLAVRLAVAADGRITQRSGRKFRNAHDYPLGYMVSARKM